MKKDHRGFSFLELIIAFALLGIVSLSVVGFIGVGANTYRSVSSEVNLQFESQVALNQLESYIVNCKGGLFYDAGGATLYIIDKPGGSWKLYSFRHDAALSQIFFASSDIAYNAATDAFTYDLPLPGDLMGEHIVGMNIDLSGIGTVDSVKISLSVSTSGRSYAGDKTVALRNQALKRDTLKELIETVCADLKPAHP